MQLALIHFRHKIRNIRKKFFIVKLVRHRNRVPKEVTDVPSLKTFKARLDGVLSNLV